MLLKLITEDSPEPGKYNSSYAYDSKKARDPKYSFGGGRHR